MRRTSALRKASTWGTAFRIIAAGASLLLVPMATRTLPTDQLELWLLLWSLVAVLGPLDLGLGGALLTRVARLDGDEKGGSPAAAFHEAVLAMTAVAVVTGGLALFSLETLGVDAMLGETDSPARPAATAMLLGLAANLPLSLGPKYLQARQHFDLVAKVGIGANAAQVVLGLIGVAAGLEIVGFVWVALSATLLLNLGCFGAAVMDCRRTPRRAVRRWGELNQLVRHAPFFWGLGLVATISFEADTLVISHVLGVPSAAAYSVPARLMLFIPGVLAFAAAGFWPAVAEARASGDEVWASKQLRRLMSYFAAISLAGGLALGLLLAPLMDLLSPGIPPPSVGLVGALLAVCVVHSVSLPVAMYMSGADLVRIELAIAALMTVVNVAASIALAHELGAAGPPLATTLAQSVTLATAMMIIVRGERLRRR